MTAIMPVQFQQIMLGDPTFIALNFGAILLVCVFIWLARTRYGRFYKLQREAIDHRKNADAQVLAHNQTFEQLISQQYGTVNAHNEQILAKAEEALRLNAETLAQISAMSRTLARIAERLEQESGTPR